MKNPNTTQWALLSAGDHVAHRLSKDNSLWVFCLVWFWFSIFKASVPLFVFLTSSSATRLYRGRDPRLTSNSFTCCYTETGQTMTSDLAVHIIRDGSSRSRSRGRGDSTRFAIPVTVTITFIFTITYFKLSLIDPSLNLFFFSLHPHDCPTNDIYFSKIFYLSKIDEFVLNPLPVRLDILIN